MIRPDILMALLLSLANLILYWHVQDFEFIVYDDPAYVVLNPMVQNGLTLEGIKWAFTAFDHNAPMWHPLTWLSLMLDREFYGMNAGGYHWTSLLLHMANTLMLFFAMRRMTDAFWQSAFVGILFAVHPLHIESVAWISERKDVLCLFFWLCATACYVRYVAQLRLRWYTLALLFFVLSLMAKPMAVTFPFVLLLLDYWPLRRFCRHPNDVRGGIASSTYLRRPALRLFIEKVPFLIPSLLASIVTFLAQESGEAVQSLEKVPLTLRGANALVAYVTYLGKALWPHDLAVFYPLPKVWPLWHVGIAFTLVIGITTIVLKLAKNHPYLFTGWFWYVGTLVPVIGLIQVGSQSMADRYTYIPLTGLFMIISWGTADILRARYRSRIYLYPFCASLICGLILVSWYHVPHWQNSVALFSHALTVTKESPMTHTSLGVALRIQGDSRGAEFHFKEALRMRPGYAEAHANLGVVYRERNEFELAALHFREAIRVFPRYEDAHFNLGQVYLLQEKYGDAAAAYNVVLGLRPDHAEAHNYLGVALVCQNNIEGAIREFETALRIQPGYIKAGINLFKAREIRNLSAAPPREHS